MNRPTYLSLFSGIGGLDLGLDRAGWECVGQVELDPFCRRVLAKHWPEVPRHDDVRTVPEWWTGGAVDAVAGGFPCQGHSVAGRRRGSGDERWGWPWFADVVDALEPRLVIIENVPNLVRTGLQDVLADLAARGFDAWWGCIPAAAVGAPHLRWRLFVLAAHAERVDVRHEPGWVSGARWAGASVAGHDGSTWLVADYPRVRRDDGGELRSFEDARGWAEPTRRRTHVADANGSRRWTRSGLGRPGTSAVGDGWWTAEPDVGRVAHGVPARVDRLRTLGNAVVPQVAELIGRMALELLEPKAVLI